MKNQIMPLPILLDTDIGNDPDDLLALAMILDRPDLFDLRAVVTTGKNPQTRCRFVNHLCELAGRDIPIGAGVPTEYSKRPTDIHLRFFEDAGVNLNNNGMFPAAEAVLKKVLSPEVTIITIGPLSTLAEFVTHFPEYQSHRLPPVFSMGGFISRKNKKFILEYNFGSDLNATKTVLSKSVEQTCVTKNVCSNIVMTMSDIKATHFANSPARELAFSFMEKWFEGRAAKKLHDPFTVAFARNTNGIRTEPVRFMFNQKGGCKGIIVDASNCRATIGGKPASLDWFFDIFYGENDEHKKCTPAPANRRKS